MKIRHTRFGNVTVLAPAGRIDHITSEEFRKSVDRIVGSAIASGEAVVFDLEQVEYISSAGLRCFMLAAKQAKAQGSQLAVAALQPVVREIFEISRFTLVFETFRSVREAIAKLSPAALPAFDAGC